MENIAILIGGFSEEKEISLKSGSTIYNHIDKSKYNAYKVLCVKKTEFKVIYADKQIKVENSNFSFIIKNKKIKLHKVFMMIHGDPGENGELCKFFEEKNIPYTSCNTKISQLTFNKFKCNNHLTALGYKVPKSNIFQGQLEIPFPCIIKPACSGSSFGISKAYNLNQLKNAIKEAKKYDNEIIIEEFIDGREFTCGVLSLNSTITTLPITEIISQNDIFDYDAKYNGNAREETPAKINENEKNKIESISKNIYNDLKLSGIIRIDFIMHNQIPYVIEINTVPGFSEESIVPQMLKCANISIKNFITSELQRLNT